MRRVQEELDVRSIKANRLALYGVKQKTLDDLLSGAEPRIGTVYTVAKALGLEAWELLTERSDASGKVVHLPAPPLPISGAGRQRKIRGTT